jgi:hypothetical protein
MRPVDWYEAEGCFRLRYQETIENEGLAEANRFAKLEAMWFLIEGLKRLLRSLFPI